MDEKSVDSDQLVSMKPANLDLHCFQKTVFWFGLMLNVSVNSYGHVGTVS